MLTPESAVAAGTASGASVDVPAGSWRELRFWPHEVGTDGWSVPLAAKLDVETDAGRVSHAVPPSEEPWLISVDGTPSTVRITLPEPSGA